jgi:hypothetical protein
VSEGRRRIWEIRGKEDATEARNAGTLIEEAGGRSIPPSSAGRVMQRRDICSGGTPNKEHNVFWTDKSKVVMKSDAKCGGQTRKRC